MIFVATDHDSVQRGEAGPEEDGGGQQARDEADEGQQHDGTQRAHLFRNRFS